MVVHVCWCACDCACFYDYNMSCLLNSQTHIFYDISKIPIRMFAIADPQSVTHKIKSSNRKCPARSGETTTIANIKCYSLHTGVGQHMLLLIMVCMWAVASVVVGLCALLL